ncbi:DUF7716 domain-containing protein [Paenibacillus sp. SGZ-1009]|uniref:DUF7716 domain-containing protein n=1 Tax=Paenibacillus campi TaxID=3106031 RepID=UPI002AFE5A8C|nr:hypothetical protein [Paenibacillus sp. SGZ-1009]
MSRYEDRLNDYNHLQHADRLTFATLDQLVAMCGKLHNNWLYTNVQHWEHDPLHTPVYYFDEDWLAEQEAQGQATENERGDIVPNDLLEAGVQTWFEMATFEDVIDVLYEAEQPVTLPMIVIALKYYYEYDAFLDYDDVEARLQLHSVLKQVNEAQSE